MTMSLLVAFRAHASMAADDICVLPVPGGLLTRTNLCLPVTVIACRCMSFKPALRHADSKSRFEGGLTYMQGRTQHSST